VDVEILALQVSRRAKGRTSEVKGIEAWVNIVGIMVKMMKTILILTAAEKAARIHMEELAFMIGRVGKFATIAAVAAAATAAATDRARAAMQMKGDAKKKMKIMLIILIAEKVATTEAAAAALHMHVARV
jgi:hypothetical protein